VDEIDDGPLVLSRHLTGGTEKKHDIPNKRMEADWLLKSDVGFSQR
jgi:hypothetical protein